EQCKIDLVLKQGQENNLNFIKENQWRKEVFSLEKLITKEIKLKLEVASLEKYWESRIIPRGLRIMLQSSTDKDDPEFNTVWDRILNNCSYELMSHIICKRKRMLAAIDRDIDNLKETLTPYLELPECVSLMEKIEKKLEKTFEEVISVKKKKYERDEQDFKENRVRDYKNKERTKKSTSREFYRKSQVNGNSPKRFQYTGNTSNRNAPPIMRTPKESRWTTV
ncbi:Hypothetical predicted protein, partial [Pelobates cultripes]